MDVSLSQNINNFYVGELYIGEKVGSLLEGANAYSDYEAKRKKEILEKKGAIDFTSRYTFTSKMNPKNRLIHTGYICLFFKDYNGYMCLMDHEIYKNTDIKYFYKNLVPLVNYLPKVDFSVKQDISMLEALKLFRKLFDNPEQFYHKRLHDIRDFYVGNICKCEEIATSRFEKEKVRVPEQHLLHRSSAKHISFSSSNFSYDRDEPRYDYTTYQSLFLIHPSGLLNLNNHQIYTLGTLRKGHFVLQEKGMDYYEWMESLSKFLGDNHIRGSIQQITIPKALKLVRKISSK